MKSKCTPAENSAIALRTALFLMLRNARPKERSYAGLIESAQWEGYTADAAREQIEALHENGAIEFYVTPAGDVYVKVAKGGQAV